MLDRAALTHIDQLHHIGCQLSLLKRVYQSYDLIIERVLKKQEATLASLKNSHIIPTSGLDSHGYDEYESAVMAASTGVSSPHGGIVIPEADSLLGVSLSSAARVRFERLRDRICLYALSEIQECIDQKESLVMMVCFSLCGIAFVFSPPPSSLIVTSPMHCHSHLLRTSTSSPSRNPSPSNHSPVSPSSSRKSQSSSCPSPS